MYHATEPVQAEVWSRIPDRFARPRPSLWGRTNFPAHDLGCFLEGPSFDREGNLYLVDIPFGRVFRVSPDGEWTLVSEYDGWPNGLKIHADGRIFITDYRLGVMQLDPSSGRVSPYLQTWQSESFKGVNDLFFGPDGAMYFTDQGQTGLHDPTGRVFRMRATGTQPGPLECLLDCGPSPNGLVLNLADNQLLVAMTRDNAVWRLPLHPDGGVSKVGRFIPMHGGVGPDGMALDEEGGLAVAHPGTSVWRFDTWGRPTDVWELPAEVRAHPFCTNVAYAGAERRMLHAVDSVRGLVLRAHMRVPGRAMYSHAAI